MIYHLSKILALKGPLLLFDSDLGSCLAVRHAFLVVCSHLGLLSTKAEDFVLFGVHLRTKFDLWEINLDFDSFYLRFLVSCPKIDMNNLVLQRP